MRLSTLANASTTGILLVFAVGAYIIYQCYLSPLSRIPGPFWAKLTKLYRAYLVKAGHSNRVYVSLHKKYGSVVRVAPNEISVADPIAFREIYRAGNQFHKAELYSVVQGSRPFDLFGERNEKIHSEQRKLVARAYSMDTMVYLEPKVDQVITRLLEKLYELSDSTIDLGSWIQLFAFGRLTPVSVRRLLDTADLSQLEDVIGAMSFSRPFGYLDAEDDHGLFAKIRASVASMAWLMHVPWIFRWHQKLMPIIGNWLAANDRNGYFFQYSSQEVRARKDRGGDIKDIMGQLFTIQQSKPQLRDMDITFMLTSNIFVGSDTTSTLLRGLFYLLLKDRRSLNLLMEELYDKKAKGELSNPVTSAQAQAWPYLQAVIYEAFRLYTPNASTLDRDVPSGGMNIGPYHIPEGSVVGTSAWVIHRIPEIWGPDVDEFRPERWLDKSSEGDLKRFFFGFGGGSRTCLGRNIVWLEVEKLVPTLLVHFDMQLADEAAFTEHCGALVFLEGLKVRIKSRQE